MPKIAYSQKRFSPGTLGIIVQAEIIIEEYTQQGFDLTLRQLYYQFVARGLIPNKQTEYKRLGSIINDARMCGLIDWSSIVDRTRSLRGNQHWEKPEDIVNDCVDAFGIDRWATQPERVEVWIEKDALIGVIENVCRRLDVPYFSCRGYTSQSEMWVAGQRINAYGVPTFILHLGDHDPSGLDMSRDIENRLQNFAAMNGGDFPEVERLALNMDQVEQYKPPPNPAKVTDSRFEKYLAEYGGKSWELDALEPSVIADLIREGVAGHLNVQKYKSAQALEKRHIKALRKVAESLGGKK